MFGGALLYTQYGFVKRRVLRKIAKDKGIWRPTRPGTGCTPNGTA